MAGCSFPPPPRMVDHPDLLISLVGPGCGPQLRGSSIPTPDLEPPVLRGLRAERRAAAAVGSFRLHPRGHAGSRLSRTNWTLKSRLAVTTRGARACRGGYPVRFWGDYGFMFWVRRRPEWFRCAPTAFLPAYRSHRLCNWDLTRFGFSFDCLFLTSSLPRLFKHTLTRTNMRRRSIYPACFTFCGAAIVQKNAG